MSGRLFRTEDWERLAIKADFRPSQMADLCGLTLRQMQRRFQKDLSVTPSEWLRRFGCRLVMKLIAEGYNNKAIVFELKFSNSAHLCHDFRRVYGASPQSFARPLGIEVPKLEPVREVA